MKLGIISDIHCDLPALERTLSVMPAVDHILCAGDMMLQYRFSNELFDLIRERKMVPVLGNHDAHILASGGMMLRRSGKIRPDHLEYLDSLPTVLEIEIDGKLIMMMHTSPLDPTGGGRGLTNGVGIPARYAHVELGNTSHRIDRIEKLSRNVNHDPVSTVEVVNGHGVSTAVRHVVAESTGGQHQSPSQNMPETEADILVVGHTHLPTIADVNGTLVINPGSLAQPRDVKNPDRRTYAILDTDTWTAEIHGFREEIGAVYR